LGVLMDFGMLGEVRLSGPGGVVDLGHTRQRSVLVALLADANKPVSVDQLLDRVWGDRPPQAARSTLFTYLTRLRQAIAPMPIERRHGGYLITVDRENLDLFQFTDLLAAARAARDDREAAELYRQALALWRGEPFPDIDTPWANDLRELLQRQRFAAELDQADVLLRLGRHGEILAELTARADRHPLDERVAGQLMLALFRGGRAADVTARYQQLHRRLVNEVGITPGPALRELHRDLLASDDAVVSWWPNPTPRQLPPPPRSFTGRAAALARLDTHFGGRSHATIVAISGGGGMGKTSLALHWAHENSERFPDGQLFVNLRGFDPRARPTSPTTVLRDFLRSLGVDGADVPGDEEAQANLFRTLVAGRRMLVLLDNAADTAQVEPLLPGSSSVVTLVTSRRPLTAMVSTHAARVVPLEHFDAAESRELLASRLGAARLAAEPAAVEEIITHCAGLPLALAIVAARAPLEPDPPLSVLAAQLRDHRTRLDGIDTGETAMSLRAVFSVSYQALGQDAGVLARLLALAPGPDISAEAVAVLAGDGAERALQALLSVHLVSQSVRGRYRMHDLVRLDATERAARLPADVRDAALLRLVSFYVATGREADRLLDPARPRFALSEATTAVAPLPLHDKKEAATWLANEHAVLTAAQDVTARWGWHAQTWELAMVTDTWHWRQGLTGDHITMLENAIVAAEAAGDVGLQSRLRRNLGQVMVARTNRLTEAVGHLERAVALAARIGLKTDEAHCHLVLARTWGEAGDTGRARQHATSALDLYREDGQTRYQAYALNQLGCIATIAGDLDEARTHCEAAVRLQEADGDVDGDILKDLGYAEELAGHLTTAVDHYLAAIQQFNHDGEDYNLATTLISLGRTYTALGSFDRATTAWQHALRLCRTQGRITEAETVEEQLATIASAAADSPASPIP
jgi:DNA-binding SARP family transcriptional activator/tetratricopeptide (TPR) repeat protein